MSAYVARSPGGVRLLLVFAAVSLAAVALGAFVCAANGVPAGSWMRNLIAWGVGAALAAGLAFSFRPIFLKAALWLAPLGLAAAFFSPDQQGVHRWIDAGPLHVNVAMLLLPAAIVALAVQARDRAWPWVAVLLCLGLLVAQPDASQATALAAAAILVAVAAVRHPSMKLSVIAAAVALAAFAWMRPDPLQPVAEVEEIVGLAFQVTPVAGVLAVLLLAAVSLTPALLTFSGTPALRLAGGALALCFALWAVMPMLGAFPVPFVGIGMSAIVGGWLGVGLLAGLMKAGPKA